MRPEMAEQIARLFEEQSEGWYTRIASLPQGVLAGEAPERSWCRICDAPTMEAEEGYR